MNKIFSMVSVFVFALTTFGVTDSKFRQECALKSKEYKQQLPSGPSDEPCANEKKKDLGEMDQDLLYVMSVAAFHEKRLDRRKNAMGHLEKFECADKAQCKEFLTLLDWGIKTGYPAKFSQSLGQRAEILRQNISVKVETFD